MQSHWERDTERSRNSIRFCGRKGFFLSHTHTLQLQFMLQAAAASSSSSPDKIVAQSYVSWFIFVSIPLFSSHGRNDRVESSNFQSFIREKNSFVCPFCKGDELNFNDFIPEKTRIHAEKKRKGKRKIFTFFIALNFYEHTLVLECAWFGPVEWMASCSPSTHIIMSYFSPEKNEDILSKEI